MAPRVHLFQEHALRITTDPWKERHVAVSPSHAAGFCDARETSASLRSCAAPAGPPECIETVRTSPGFVRCCSAGRCLAKPRLSTSASLRSCAARAGPPACVETVRTSPGFVRCCSVGRCLAKPRRHDAGCDSMGSLGRLRPLMCTAFQSMQLPSCTMLTMVSTVPHTRGLVGDSLV